MYVLHIGGCVGQCRLFWCGLFVWLDVPGPRLLGLGLARQHAFHVARDQLGGRGRRPRQCAQVVDGHAYTQPPGRGGDASHCDQRRRDQKKLCLCGQKKRKVN